MTKFVDQIVNYFDLNEEPPEATAKLGKMELAEPTEQPPPHPPPERSIPVWEQLLLYFASVVGVLLSRAVTAFNPNEASTLHFSWGSVLVACVIGLMIIPYAFAQLRISASVPLLFRLGLFVQ